MNSAMLNVNCACASDRPSSAFTAGITGRKMCTASGLISAVSASASANDRVGVHGVAGMAPARFFWHLGMILSENWCRTFADRALAAARERARVIGQRERPERPVGVLDIGVGQKPIGR